LGSREFSRPRAMYAKQGDRVQHRRALSSLLLKQRKSMVPGG
jgi:hypothetical protein